MSIEARRAQLQRAGKLAQRESEVSRVLRLPRVVADDRFSLAPWVRPGASERWSLRPTQCQSLSALRRYGGLLGALGVGHGKTLVALLAGMVADCDSSLVLVAPATIPKFREVLEDLQQTYDLPPTRLVSWGELSRAEGWQLLQSAAQGARRLCVVADETHMARNATAARTARLMRFLDSTPGRVFVALSGTLTTRRLADYAHLAARALGEYSPVPRGREGEAWDAVLANEYRSPADLAHIAPLWEWAEVTRGEPMPRCGAILPEQVLRKLHAAYGERLASCPGVVLTQDASCDAPLRIYKVSGKFQSIKKIWQLAEEVSKTCRDPDGIELPDDAEVAKIAKRLTFGYYYRWQWPGDKVDVEWLDARQTWARTCRAVVEANRGRGLDTEGLVAAAARRNLEDGGLRAQGRLARDWARWVAVKDRPGPTPVPVWVTDEPLQHLVDIARKQAPALIWYDELAVADRLRQLGVEVVASGQRVQGPPRVLAVSLRSHGTGLDGLQAWSRAVFACVPANGGSWEQVLGRLHRQGQQADAVCVWVPVWAGPQAHALRTARHDAEWIATTTGNAQKLLLAQVVDN